MNSAVGIMAIILLALLFFKVPVFVAVLGASVVYFVLTPGINPAVFAQQAITGSESVTLLAIPFFVCAGVLMNYTGVTKRIMDFCAVLTGRMYGGLSQVNILLKHLDGRTFPVPHLRMPRWRQRCWSQEMESKGIGRAFSTVVTAASSMITPLIPPGIGLILYGCIANVSIGKLFIAGFGPGILLCATMMFMVSKISKKRGYLPLRKEKMTGTMFWTSFKPAILPLCLPIIIIGGVRLGIFTADRGRCCCDRICGSPRTCVQRTRTERDPSGIKRNADDNLIHHADRCCSVHILLDPHKRDDPADVHTVDDLRDP